MPMPTSSRGKRSSAREYAATRQITNRFPGNMQPRPCAGTPIGDWAADAHPQPWEGQLDQLAPHEYSAQLFVPCVALCPRAFPLALAE